MGALSLKPEQMSEDTIKATLAQVREGMANGEDLATLLLKVLNVVEDLHSELKKAQRRNAFLEAELEKRKRGKSSDDDSDDSSSETGTGQENKSTSKKNYSSEKRRRTGNNKHHGRRSKAGLEVHETRRCEIDRRLLPEDAQCKGWEPFLGRDIIIREWNVLFLRQVYYSPSENNRYIAPIPEGWQGEFGPTLRTTVVSLKYDGGMSEAGVVRFLQAHHIDISKGSVSNILLQVGAFFHQEKLAILRRGYQSQSFVQSDDTSARVMGESWHTHIVCHDDFAVYFTRPFKDRMTVIDVLLGRTADQRCYRYTDLSEELLEMLGVSQRQRDRLKELVEAERDYEEKAMTVLLIELFADRATSAAAATKIREAMALTYFHEQEEVCFPATLLTDGAPQYELLSLYHAICWIHDGRHYEKLDPLDADFARKLERFRTRYWAYYHELSAWRQLPEAERTPEKAEELGKKFDRLFRARTGYDKLDERIVKSREKKEQMLVVLVDPRVPLHNNASELEARIAARRRDISLHSRSLRGVEAMDSLTSVVETSRKLGIRAARYVFDRLCGLELESERALPALIEARAGP